MSFVRAGQRKKKVIIRKKPSWDDSVNDLSVYKPSQEELAIRHAAHKSKNHMTVKLEKMRKAKQKNSSLSNAEARQMAIMKEVLYDQKQLHDTLSKSDKMMAVVKDLFGDDPKRFMGFPNVTTVPGSEQEQLSRTGGIVAPVTGIKTKSETLSESVMDQVALNDFSDSESDDDRDAMEPIVYQPQMNLKRFQQFLAAEEERNQTISSIGGQAQLSQNEVGPIQSTRLQMSQEDTGCETPRRGHNESIEMLRTPRSAINDTKKVKKTKKRVSPQKENRTQNNSALNLTDLRKVLGNLENEIEQYEKQTGRCPPAEKQRSETFSGYTVALVDSVSKLATYLRETDLRLKAETTVREHLTQDVLQHRIIIDALTADIIVTQDQYSKILTEFQQYKSETRAEIDRLKMALQGSGRGHPAWSEPSASLREERIVPPSQPNQEYPSKPVTGVAVDMDSNYTALPEHISSHAVVLSPPVRKTRLTDRPEPQPAQPKRQMSLIDVSTLAESDTQHVPSYGQISRQNPVPPQMATVSVPRPAPLVQSNIPGGNLSADEVHHQPSQSAYVPDIQTSAPMSEQIAELNRQHEEAQKRLQLLFQQQEQQHMQMVRQQQQKFQQQQQQETLQLQNTYPPPVVSSTRPRLEQGVHGMDSRDISQPVQHQQTVTPPRTLQTQSRVQGPISPPISPISHRSDNMSVLQHLQGRQRQYGGGAGREITVSLPVMDLETSAGSLPSPTTISAAH